MRWLLLTILLAGGATFADTWRWVDENGVVNFSDQPHPGAERVDLRSVQTYTPPEWAQERAERSRDEGDAAVSADRLAVTILRPQQDETLWNVEGSLDVLVDVKPGMARKQQVIFFLDGNRVPGAGGAGDTFVLTQVFRGAHTLRAAVENPDGSQAGVSRTVKFNVQQTSVLNPNNPNNRPGIRPPIARPPVVRPRVGG